MSASNEGDRRDGSASPGKRKSTTPGTDTSHTQRGTSHEYEGESVASETHDGAYPIAKRHKLEADVDVPITQTETSQAEIDTHQGSAEASRDETETGASKTDEAGNEGENQQTEAGDKNEDEVPIAKPEPKLCGICKSQPGKYKCPQPSCQLAYCSVGCNKTHRENHPPPPPPPAAPSSKPADNSPTTTGNKQPHDPYEVLLRHRAEFDRLLQRYPGLDRVLAKIQEATLPPPDQPANSLTGGVPAAVLQQTGGVSGFNPLISSKNYYGGGSSSSKNKQPQIWSGEVGLRKGAEALKKARTDPGVHGDGVREFCELVMYLLNNPSLRRTTSGGGGGGGGSGAAATATATKTSLNATSLVREEVVADQARVIQTLLEVEGGGDDL